VGAQSPCAAKLSVQRSTAQRSMLKKQSVVALARREIKNCWFPDRDINNAWLYKKYLKQNNLSAIGSYFIPSMLTATPEDAWWSLAGYLSSQLEQDKHGVGMRKMNLNEESIAEAIIRTKLMKALRPGGVLSVATRVPDSGTTESNVISDVVQSKCMQYLCSFPYKQISKDKVVCDLFMYKGEEDCETALSNVHMKQYLACKGSRSCKRS
jgi:hypothetical protein